MSVIIVTGSSGLVGSETCKLFHQKGLDVIGIDNFSREVFFGKKSSNRQNAILLKHKLKRFKQLQIDIRNKDKINKVFRKYGRNISAVIHSAAQPSHEWSSMHPIIDFEINTQGTLNILSAVKYYSPNAVFIYLSTNKVYGENPNKLPFQEYKNRWEIRKNHPYYKYGIDENMSIDQTTHTIFGANKLSGDILSQEYGLFYSLKTAIFRCGCITGPTHYGTRIHGFLSFLVKCFINNEKYIIEGYKGKQVRDNIHAADLSAALWEFYTKPKIAAVYNIGGGRKNSCSIIEAYNKLRNIIDKDIKIIVNPNPRKADHKWWITDIRKFQKDYPKWKLLYSLNDIFEEMISFYL